MNFSISYIKLHVWVTMITKSVWGRIQDTGLSQKLDSWWDTFKEEIFKEHNVMKESSVKRIGYFRWNCGKLGNLTYVAFNDCLETPHKGRSISSQTWMSGSLQLRIRGRDNSSKRARDMPGPTEKRNIHDKGHLFKNFKEVLRRGWGGRLKSNLFLRANVHTQTFRMPCFEVFWRKVMICSFPKHP